MKEKRTVWRVTWPARICRAEVFSETKRYFHVYFVMDGYSHAIREKKDSQYGARYFDTWAEAKEFAFNRIEKKLFELNMELAELLGVLGVLNGLDNPEDQTS